jgi:tetratricopeptide (TPR) repeat protein
MFAMAGHSWSYSAAGKACMSVDPFRKQQIAIDLCNQAIAEKSNSNIELSELYHQRGEAFYWALRPDFSMENFNKAMELNPDNTEAQIQRGWAKLRLSDPAGAFTDFSEALAREPNSGRAMFAIGYLYFDTPAHERALAAYEQAVVASPKYYLARLGLFNYLFYKVWNPERAMQEINTLIAAGEKDLYKVRYFENDANLPIDFYAYARYKRSVLLDSLRRYDEALKDLNWLIARYPNAGAYYYDRATLHAAKRDFVPALADANKEHELRPYCECTLHVKLQALYSLRRHDELVKIADDIVGSMTTLAYKDDAYFWRAIVEKQRGDIVSAKRDFETSFSLDPLKQRAGLTQLIQSGYYEGEISDGYSERASNGLDACLLDPECMK